MAPKHAATGGPRGVREEDEITINYWIQALVEYLTTLQDWPRPDWQAGAVGENYFTSEAKRSGNFLKNSASASFCFHSGFVFHDTAWDVIAVP
jgi:hypothetical protein